MNIFVESLFLVGVVVELGNQGAGERNRNIWVFSCVGHREQVKVVVKRKKCTY